MKTVLMINGSMFGEESASTSLSEDVVKRIREEHGPVQVIRRDFAQHPVPHLDAATFKAFGTPSEERSEAQQQAVAYSDELINELADADFVVIGLPMYNFSVPSSVKAWFDYLARAGVTFQYTEDGPKGLLADRPVYIVSTRGGRYAGTPADNQSDFVRQFFALIGLTSVQFVYAEGMGQTQSRDRALEKARQTIAELAA